MDKNKIKDILTGVAGSAAGTVIGLEVVNGAKRFFTAIKAKVKKNPEKVVETKADPEKPEKAKAKK